MSGIKRSLNAEDDSAIINGTTEQAKNTDDSPNSKRSRHSSSHSDNEEETQILEHENGITNGHSTSQSETDDENDDDEENPGQENSSDYSVVHVDFDNGNDDIFRYDGPIIFHIHIPSRGRSGKLSSKPTIIRTMSWVLTAHIKPNNDNSQRDNTGTLGLFLACQLDKTSQSWSIFAKAEFILLHPVDANKNVVKKINHFFNSRAIDWGFHNFKLLKEVYSEYLHSPDNTIRIEAKIHADPPRNIDWNSKAQTGFVGLKNIGATCYMNSFLQTIYFTKKLRKLLDKLECKMEGTTLEGMIPSLFQGQYVQYVRCTKVDHESRVQQTFYDVPLQVRNNANITESFRDFCKTEILTGENLYDAGSIHGLQEAEKGVKFQKFPPVLCLHLLRFEYDFNLSQNRKINDSYSFDYHLDLSEFLEKPNCSPCSYKLLSILVHSGDNSSGHYVSFINPELDEQWFKFDDDVVARVPSNDAMDRNFGGIQDDDGIMYNTSAYMLVYIREDCQNDVLCDINLEDIPENLIKRFDYDKKSIKTRQAVLDNNSFVDIHVILDSDFAIHPTDCLTKLIYDYSLGFSQNKRCLRYIKAQRSELFGEFAQRLAYELGVNLDEDIRLWLVNAHEVRLNHHFYSPTSLISVLAYCNDYDKKIIDLFGYEISARRVSSIFVEQKLFLNNIYQLLPFSKDDDMLIFVRFYNSRDESLLYIGHFLFPQQQSLQKCFNSIADRLQIPISTLTTFIVHQSIPKHNQTHQYESISSPNFELPLSEALRPCLSGVSITIQILNINPTDNETSFTTVDDYMRNLSMRQEFDVYNRDSLRNECLFKLNLPLTTSINEVIRFIAERIAYSEQQIIIQKSSNSSLIAGNILSTPSLHIGCEQKLRDLYPNIRHIAAVPRKIFFKRLPFNYTELEHRRLFRIFVTNPTKKDEQQEVQFYVRKSSTVADFLTEIKQWMPSLCSENSNQQLRIIELILSNQINPPFQLRICPDESTMDEYNTYVNHYYHLEAIIDADIDHSQDSVLIPVAHYTKENFIQINFQKFFPFFLHVIQNESFHDVKHRLQIKLNLPNREFEKYRFAIFNGSKLLSRCDDNTGNINLCDSKSIQNPCWLGLEIPSVSNPRKTRKSLFSEKPIRIN